MERIIRLNAVETSSQKGITRMKHHDLHPQNNFGTGKVSAKKAIGNKELLARFPANRYPVGNNSPPLFSAASFSWDISTHSFTQATAFARNSESC
jgi:hypothetical protein